MPLVADVAPWEWGAAALGAATLGYAALLAGLAVAGRSSSARALARLLPDVAVLLGRLLRDPRVPRRRKAAVLAGIGYLAVPLDLVPDFIPVVGQLDDAAVAALVLRYLARSGGPGLLEELWPGRAETLRGVLILAGCAGRETPGSSG